MANSITVLNFGENSIQIAEGSSSNGKINVQGFAASDNTPPIFQLLNEKTIQDVSKIIDGMTKTAKITNRNAMVVIPDTFTYSQIVTMPKLKEKELMSAIRYQADQFIPLPLEEAAIDLEIIYEDKVNNTYLVLIVATSQKLVSNLISIVESSGLIPERLTNELSTISAFLSAVSKPSQTQTGTLFLNMGVATSSFYLFHEGLGMVVDNHVAKVGFDIFVKEIKANLNLEMGKATEALQSIGFQQSSMNIAEIVGPVVSDLEQEIRKFSLAMTEKHHIPVNKVILGGYACRINHFAEALSQHIGVPATTYNLAQYLTQSPALTSIKGVPAQFINAISGCYA